MSDEPAEIVKEYGPYPGAERVHGVTYDGRSIWFASDRLYAVSPESGEITESLDVACTAGTAFDGRYFYQIDRAHIQKVEPKTGRVLATIPAPAEDCSGLTWAEGALWVGQYGDRKIHKIDPETGAILRTLSSDRFVTGVSWVDGELWHATWEDNRSELRQLDPQTGRVQRRMLMPEDTMISGLESDGKDVFYCGGGTTGKVRAVRRKPKRK